MQPVDPTSQSAQPASDIARLQQMQAAAELTRRMKNGANTFYWIAGLSVINSVLAFTGSDTRFVIGLGITQFVDAIAQLIGQEVPEAKMILTIVAVLIDLAIIGVFAFFGYFSGKGRRWAFIIGIALYSLDTLLMLVFQTWLALGFHILFTFALFGGLSALNQLEKLSPKSQSSFPQNIGVP